MLKTFYNSLTQQYNKAKSACQGQTENVSIEMGVVVSEFRRNHIYYCSGPMYDVVVL